MLYEINVDSSTIDFNEITNWCENNLEIGSYNIFDHLYYGFYTVVLDSSDSMAFKLSFGIDNNCIQKTTPKVIDY